MKEHFARLARGGRRELGFERVGAEGVSKWQERLRQALAERMALHCFEPHEVRAQVIGSEQAEGFRRHLIRIQGRDGAVIPAYWLVPDTVRSPAAVVIALHGHGPGKAVPAGASQDVQRNELQIVGERDYAARAARQGYSTLAPDLRGFGEMTLPEALLTRKDSTCTEMSMRAIAAGQSLVGMRVRDVMSCVDWVSTLPEADRTRIVVTGQSGGGTYSLWSAAMDTRISAAVPACGFCTFEHAIMSVHHCPCNYLPGVLDICDYSDLAGLIAPRPLLIVTGALDPLFPLEGVRIAFGRVQQIYATAGAADRLELFVGPEGHRYYAEPVWPFLEKSLAAHDDARNPPSPPARSEGR